MLLSPSESLRALKLKFHEWMFLACFGLLGFLICGGWLYWWAVDYRLAESVAACEAENNDRIVASFNQAGKTERGWQHLLFGQLVCDPSALRKKSATPPPVVEGRVLSAYQAKYFLVHPGGSLRVFYYVVFGLICLGVLPAVGYFVLLGLRSIGNATGND
jgi:hypothetical protein